MVNIKKKVSRSEEDINGGLPSEIEEMKKSCVDCHATTTPLWRGGPAGRRTLCNACGIRLMKKRRAAFAEEKSRKKKMRSENKINMVKLPWKMRLMGLGRKWVLQRSTTSETETETTTSSTSTSTSTSTWRGELGEEEEAALLLMALSCGSFLS